MSCSATRWSRWRISQIPAAVFPAFRGPFIMHRCGSFHCCMLRSRWVSPKGALNDLAEMAGTGRRQFRAARAMRDSEVLQYELGCPQANFRAARSYLESQAARHWSRARAGTLRDEALMTEGIQAAVWITNACLRVAERCFALGGGSAVYEDSKLQRRLRDLHVASQHAFVQQSQNMDAAKLFISSASNGLAPSIRSASSPVAQPSLRRGT